jgi:glycosyltransferase involved in cell wall biosynthesis
MKISIIVPARNEARNIAKVLAGVRPFADEIIVVDGHSVDDTAQIASQFGATVVLDNGRGKGDAIRVGAAAATGDVLVFIDADQSHDPNDIEKLLGPILNGDADHVSGSRMLGGSDELFSSISEFFRLVGSEIITLTIGRRFGIRLTDSQNGFRSIRRDVFKELELTENITTIEQEMVIETLRRGYRLVEVPTHEHRRASGTSSIVIWKVGFRYVFCLSKNVSKPILKRLPAQMKSIQEKYRSRWESAKSSRVDKAS